MLHDNGLRIDKKRSDDISRHVFPKSLDIIPERLVCMGFEIEMVSSAFFCFSCLGTHEPDVKLPMTWIYFALFPSTFTLLNKYIYYAPKHNNIYTIFCGVINVDMLFPGENPKRY